MILICLEQLSVNTHLSLVNFIVVACGIVIGFGLLETRLCIFRQNRSRNAYQKRSSCI